MGHAALPKTVDSRRSRSDSLTRLLSREFLVTLPAGFGTQASDVPNVQSALMKTNAIRLLGTLGIAYTLREYEVDPDDLAAESVAQKLGMPPEQVFKTLVVRGDKTGICLAVIPGNTQLDLKALAKLTGDRTVQPVALKEVQPLTGYIRGGVTALACKKAYPVYVDELIEAFNIVSISAGIRGLQILLAPADYLQAVKGVIGAISQHKA